MKIVDEYNEVATKKYLELLHGKDTVSFNDIYGVLGMEKVKNPVYGEGDVNLFIKFCNYFSIVPQNQRDRYNQYQRILNESYGSGNYFHLRSNPYTNANERMIINVDTQQNVFKIVQNIKEKASVWIKSIKLFGIKTGNKTFKYDKIVIYYDKLYREKIYHTIYTDYITAEVLKRDLSGFYHIFDIDNSTVEYPIYPVGIGKEVSGTSFTTETTLEIHHEMTGTPKPDAKKHKDKQFAVLPNIITMNKVALSNLLFDAGKTVCEKHFKIQY